MKRAIFVPFDQLHREYGALADADPKKDLIIFVESQRMLKSRTWHIQRLWFMISAARHFAHELTAAGFKVAYLKAESTRAGIKSVMKSEQITKVIAATPNSYRMSQELSDLVEFIPNDHFLTTRDEFNHWAKNQKSLLMENFYRNQRKKFDLLMDGDKPTGGAWNFDKENRLPPPKNYQYPAYLVHEVDQLDKEVLEIGRAHV